GAWGGGGGADPANQVVECFLIKQSSLDPPKIELMRFTAVESVDGVSTIDEARAGEEHVGIRSRRDSPQEPRHHGRCVCAKNRRGRHVPRVARIPRGGLGGVAKSSVTIGECR